MTSQNGSPLLGEPPTLSCRLVKSLVVFFAETYGTARLEAVLQEAKLPDSCDVAFLSNEDNWLPAPAAQALIDALADAAPDPQFVRLAGRRMVARDILGRGYTFLEAFGNPGICYERSVHYARIYNRAGTYIYRLKSSRSALLYYRSAWPRPNRRLCEMRLGQYEAFPTIWKLPFARVKEVQCQMRGDPHCCYALEWINRAHRLAPLGAAAGGVLTATVLHVLSPAFPWTAWSIGGVALLFAVLKAWHAEGHYAAQLLQTLERQNEDYAAMIQSLRDANTILQARVKDNASLYAQAAEAVQTRDRFLSIASHELKTPITPLRLRVQSTLRAARAGDLTPERLDKNLSVIDLQVGRIVRLSDELLDVSRIAVGQLTLQLEPTDFSDVAHEVVQRLRPVIEGAGLELHTDIAPNVRGTWDPMRLDQVLSNLLTNAMKYGGGKPITVALGQDANGDAVLVVRDQGIGIAPANQVRVFERFERAVSERNYGGLGLGLWIVRQIVDALGGDIALQSALNEGATFTLRIPRDGRPFTQQGAPHFKKRDAPRDV